VTNPRIGDKCWYVYLQNIRHGEVTKVFADEKPPLYWVSDDEEGLRRIRMNPRYHFLWAHELIRDEQ